MKEKLACRICNFEGDLSEDHVPPRSITGGAAALKRDLVEYMTNPNVTRGHTKQNGIKFKTICARCNSRLGSRFDPELTKLANFCRGFYWANQRFDISLTIKPARLIRSVAGHLVAGTTQDYHSTFDKAVQDYLSDENSFLPEEIKIFCWIHPFENTVIVRDTCIMWTRISKISFVQLIKFFPIGFAFTTEEDLPRAMDITHFVRCGIDEVRKISCPPIINIMGWPETPADSPDARAILGGQSFYEGVYAIPKPTKWF